MSRSNLGNKHSKCVSHSRLSRRLVPCCRLQLPTSGLISLRSGVQAVRPTEQSCLKFQEPSIFTVYMTEQKRPDNNIRNGTCAVNRNFLTCIFLEGSASEDSPSSAHSWLRGLRARCPHQHPATEKTDMCSVICYFVGTEALVLGFAELIRRGT